AGRAARAGHHADRGGDPAGAAGADPVRLDADAAARPGRGRAAGPRGIAHPGAAAGRRRRTTGGGGSMSSRSSLSRIVGTAAGSALALALLVCGCVFAALAGPALSLHTRTQALHQTEAGFASTTKTLQVTG